MMSLEGEGTTHLFNQTDRKTGQKCLSRYRSASLVMETPENITFLIGSIILFQNYIPLGVFLHPSENVLICNPAVSCLRSMIRRERFM